MREYREPSINWHTTTVEAGPFRTYGFRVMASLSDVPAEWLGARLVEDLKVQPNLVRVESGYHDERGVSAGSIAVAGLAQKNTPAMVKVIVENAVRETLRQRREADAVVEEYTDLFRAHG